MSQMAPEDITILEDLEAFDPACELGVGAPECDRVAKWIMFRTPNACACKSRPPALACEECKEHRMHSEGAVRCRSCGDYIAPARLGYSRIEPL